jgi:putative ABC transport system permease protein
MSIIDEIFSNLTNPDLWIRLAFASVMVILLIGLSIWKNTKLEKKIIWSFIRGLIQIVLLGSILLLIFGIEQLWILYGILFFMCVFAAYTNSKSYPYPKIFQINLVGITFSSMLIMTFVIFSGAIPNFNGIIYQTSSSQSTYGSFVIPIGSMTIFFAMRETGLTLERAKSDILKSRGVIEAALSLGASPAKAIKNISRDAYRVSLVPTLNRIAVLGVVNIPGLMSGMIVGGASPIAAAIYQVVIFMMLMSAAFISTIISSHFFTKQFFTTDDQLNLEFFYKVSNIEKEKNE